MGGRSNAVNISGVIIIGDCGEYRVDAIPAKIKTLADGMWRRFVIILIIVTITRICKKVSI